MALINYLTRVHFADRVLEEAVRSELEALGRPRLMVVAEPADTGTTGFDRLTAGLPRHARVEIYDRVPRLAGAAAVAALADRYRAAGAEVLVAYGSRRAINLAKLARLQLAAGGAAGGLPRPGTAERVLATEPPQLIAVPGLDGIAAAVSPQTPVETAETGYEILNRRDLLPAVAVCDPTLTAGAPATVSASSGVEAIGGCIEAYLSNVYNPPADGIALDGLRRGATHFRAALERDLPEARREMMASALNGALALQKGYGAAQTLAMALTAIAAARERALDAGAVVRLVLPELLRFHADAAKEKYQPLRSTMRIVPEDTLSAGVRHLFAPLPLPGRLEELGLARDDLARGAAIAAGTLRLASTPRAASREDLHAILDAVY